MAEKIIKLNVGGKIYITTSTTLLSKGENYFSPILSGRFSSVMIDDAYFIDRNGELFEYILDFLRCGNTIIPNDLKLRVKEEAHFFMIEELIKALTPPDKEFQYGSLLKEWDVAKKGLKTCAQEFDEKLILRYLFTKPGQIYCFEMEKNNFSCSIFANGKSIIRCTFDKPEALNPVYAFFLNFVAFLGTHGFKIVSSHRNFHEITIQRT